MSRNSTARCRRGAGAQLGLAAILAVVPVYFVSAQSVFVEFGDEWRFFRGVTEPSETPGALEVPGVAAQLRGEAPAAGGRGVRPARERQDHARGEAAPTPGQLACAGMLSGVRAVVPK